MQGHVSQSDVSLTGDQADVDSIHRCDTSFRRRAGVWRKDKCYVLSIHFESFAENRIC